MLTNSDLPLSVALWLISDSYDYNSDPKTISATSLLRPLRSTVLSKRVVREPDADITTMLPSRIGTAIHDAIEYTWKQPRTVKEALTKLNIPARIQERIKINPEPDTLEEGDIPIYMERRSHKKMGDWTISGKFDFVMDGQLEDYKSTKTYGYISKSNVPDYVRQGSIYRWLNQDIITKDTLQINYIFTDWMALNVLKSADYPKKNILAEKYELMSIPETELFIKSVLNQLDKYMDLPQEKLPRCTKEELWQTPTIYKFYATGNIQGRATKNFESLAEANTYSANHKSNKGVVRAVPGTVKRCHYCDARPICDQAQEYVLSGLLV